MLRVIVNVRRQGEATDHDLEVPAEVPSAQLAESIAKALDYYEELPGYSIRYVLRADPPGRSLRPDESLADAGLWDGSCLIFRQVMVRGETFRPVFLESPTGRVYQLDRPQVQIGRRSVAAPIGSEGEGMVDLLDEPGGRTVSRHHADIIFDKDTWSIVAQQKARNETTVSGRLVEREESCQIVDGDHLQFGDVRLQFRLKASESRSGANDRVVPPEPYQSEDTDSKSTEPQPSQKPILMSEAGQTFVLAGPEARVGRGDEKRGIHPEIDLRGLPEATTISRRHVRIHQRGDGWVVVKENGAARTLLNGEPLEEGVERPLRHEDCLTLGTQKLTFVVG